jgi:hypothetical protein
LSVLGSFLIAKAANGVEELPVGHLLAPVEIVYFANFEEDLLALADLRLWVVRLLLRSAVHAKTDPVHRHVSMHDEAVITDLDNLICVLEVR